LYRSSSGSSSGIVATKGESKTPNEYNSSLFEVVVPRESVKNEQPKKHGQSDSLLYRTLDRVANNPYLTCASVDEIDDHDYDYDYGQNNRQNVFSCQQRYRNSNPLFRCGIQRNDSEDDEYEIDCDEYELRVWENHYKSDPRNDRNSKTSTLTNNQRRKRIPHKQRRNDSLYRKTMMTAATVNETNANANANANASNDAETSSSNNNGIQNTAQQHLQKTARFARGFADDAGRAIGNLLPTASLQNLTARKYTLPDKTVASQVLMYRQLLHTKCRPGLKLSRNYEGTPAQNAVMHMPWWEEGIAESKKMVISYDNLITRLWLNGAIEPYKSSPFDSGDLLSLGASESDATVETLVDEDGLPPVPHPFWVDRLGFQQQDPVTDFRSGGVLSLAMLVYMVESKPAICQRFFTGDTAVLPFGITCINVTDMIAKFLMLAKSTDRMDALLSQKPFWKMFADPNAITAVQELAMSMMCDVAVELGEEKRIPYLAKKSNTNEGMADASDKVRILRDCSMRRAFVRSVGRWLDTAHSWMVTASIFFWMCIPCFVIEKHR